MIVYMKKAKYVIIGNSAAGIGCAEGIRSVDKDGTIIIISDEKYHTYSRPLISYLLLGKTDEQRMKYRGDDFYENNAAQLIAGEKVVNIDTDKKSVELESGEKIGYEKLMVSTGSSPFVPPMDGLDKVDKKFTFMTLDSAKALEKELSPNARALIIGAGLIGLKCAEGIKDRVKSVTVVDLAPRVLSSILDDEGSDIIKEHLENNGVDIILSDSVKEFSGNCAKLNSGNTVEYDILILAVGVRPNVSLVKDAGGKVNRGIVVSEKLETSLPDVYAAGDCTESHDISSDSDKILALLPNAYMQGECAGINMAGGEAEFDKAIPMNAIGFFGKHIITAGTYTGEEHLIKTDSSYKKLFTENDLLKGYIIIGDIEKSGIYTSIIREKIPLSEIDFELVLNDPGLMAFSRSKREELINGKFEG